MAADAPKLTDSFWDNEHKQRTQPRIHPSFPEVTTTCTGFPSQYITTAEHNPKVNQQCVPPSAHACQHSEESSISSAASTTPDYKVYKSRYYVLLVFSLILFLQCMVWNTWGPISESALEAFPSWSEATIATLANWGPITSTIFVLPTAWAVDRWGLRPVVVLFTACTAAANGLRCIFISETIFTVMAHVCAVVNGIEATMLLAGAMIPAVWFPAQQRITATAVSSAFNQMGSGGSFLTPMLVRAPTNTTSTEEIRHDIRTLMFIDLGLAASLFMAVLAYFPSSPPTPPSHSSEIPRLNFSRGFRHIARNRHFWQLIIPYALFTGVSRVWIGVINFSLKELDVDQEEAAWIGIYSNICTGVVCIGASKLTDLFYNRLKTMLIFLMFISSICYIWFMLLTLDVITSTKVQVYITVLGGQSFNFATSPLFFELCAESVYPSPESAVGTIGLLLNNFVSAIFLFLFYIPGISDNGNTWMTYLLVASNVVSIPPVLLAKVVHNRSILDRKNLEASEKET